MSDNDLVLNEFEKIIPSFNDSPYERILAIGDIHGKFDKFQSLWNKLEVTDKDLVIFLGDYIDRGESVADVLQWILINSKKKNFIFLRGNHEQFMLNSFDEKNHDEFFNTWITNGGAETLMGLKASTTRLNTKHVLKFFETLPIGFYMEVGKRKYFFCHAGVRNGIPLDQQSAEDLLWIRYEFLDNYDGEEIIIVGHTKVQDFSNLEGKPLIPEGKTPIPMKVPNRNIVMMDTGPYLLDGKMSCLDILSGKIWLSDD